MRAIIPTGALCLVVGYVLAHFLVLLYNNWYFAELFWLKTALLTPILALGYLGLLYTPWRSLWLALGCYWIVVHALGLWTAKGPSLAELGFTAVLNLEAAMIWVSVIVTAAYGAWHGLRAGRIDARQQRQVHAQLEMRRRLRRAAGRNRTAVLVACLAPCLAVLMQFNSANADDVAPPNTVNPDQQGADQGFLTTDDAEPTRIYPNRHGELGDASQRLQPADPEWPGVYPTPAQLREREVFFIAIENRFDGAISVITTAVTSPSQCCLTPPSGSILQLVGHVLAPVTQVNPKGFTASGWAEPGTICASAVNAIHLKTDHNYNDGRGVIFSLLPIEFAEFDPKAYKSYFNKSSSLFTDITAGSTIFGGQWSPLVGSRIMLVPGGDYSAAQDIVPGYVPKDGDVLLLRVERRKYNPEWIEFENSFGGLIWIKEIGMDAYPIGQVLKPVVGIGRFLGTQYTGIGRIRAAHPGVICISTSPMNTIGGFQIIPRDHAMSPEMTNARVKTQWMVVGPLWALDPSWEGLPPLFTDYFYPAFSPAFTASGELNDDINGAAVFLDRFTVRARYSDAEDPQRYILLREADIIDNYALKTMTHLRIYFPRS